MKWASVNRTLFNPFSFFKQIERSSLDSGCASAHACGGERKRSQLRQKDTEACFGIPSVISTVFLKHETHKFAVFGTMGVPQSAQRIWWTAGPGVNSITRGEFNTYVRLSQRFLKASDAVL